MPLLNEAIIFVANNKIDDTITANYRNGLG